MKKHYFQQSYQISGMVQFIAKKMIKALKLGGVTYCLQKKKIIVNRANVDILHLNGDLKKQMNENL